MSRRPARLASRLPAALCQTLCLALCLALPSPARAAGDGAPPEGTEAADRLAQARHFARKGWHEDALVELDAALATAAGAESFAVHWLAAEVCWELLDPLRAGEHAARAAELAPDEARRATARALADSYALEFGAVVVEAPHEGMTSRLQLEPTSPQYDPELSRYVDRLSLALRAPTTLPARVGLPAGTYLVNGHEVTVTAGGEQVLALPMRSLGARGLAALQVTRLELGVGVGVLAGPAVDDIRPAPTAQVALVQPVGPLLVGLLVDGSLSSWLSSTGQGAGPVPTGLVGLRLGHEIALAAPLALRPAAVYRVGWQPGLPLACARAGEAWSCVDAGDPAEAQGAGAMVYATGAAHRPGLELAVDWREAGRTTALGVGVRALVDQAIGTRPSSGEARLADGSTISWETTDTRWTATGVQLTAALSLAF